MKIYTKIGDKGETLLANGSRIKKSSLRIASYGTVDELNAQLALFRDLLIRHETDHKFRNFLIDSVFRIQNQLFSIGSELALTNSKHLSHLIDAKDHALLEQEIDTMWAQLPPLKNFILPGGHITNSQAHVCRAVCRRSERVLCELIDHEEVRADLLVYFNRLSDWLFAASRICNSIFHAEEVIWKGIP